MAVEFEKLSFTKDWNNASDFPTYEEDEAQVRADLQALHDETKEFINEKLIPNIENLAVPGAGDMLAAIYDPNGKREDVFRYADDKAAAITRESLGAASDTAFQQHIGEFQQHIGNQSNPHNVTAEQLGAVSSDSYMWEKCTPQSYSYTVASSTSSVRSDSGRFIYATSITYDGSNLTLVNPTTVSVFSDGDGCIPSGTFFAEGTSATVSVCYKAATDTGTNEWGEYGSASGYKVTGTIIAPVYIETLLSSNINAYPQNATQGGYYYRFIGKLFERMGRVQTGSYTGTGTCGASNPCSLTFSFAPKLVWITGGGYKALFFASELTGSYVSKGYVYGDLYAKDSSYALMDANTLKWYEFSAATQMNTSGVEYTWCFIG